MSTENQSIWVRMQKVDSKVIYVLLLLSIIIPMVLPSVKFPIVPSQQSKDFFEGINKVASETPNKLIIVDGFWGAGTRGEQKWQTQAIITHLMRKHLKFALLSFDTQNATLMRELTEKLAKDNHYVYGADWINFGYRPQFGPTVKGIGQDLPGTIKNDYAQKPLSQFPIMAGVKTGKDIGAVIDITPSSTMQTWIGLFQGSYHTPFFYAPTAVMAPEGYPYLDSGQITGILTGIKGAGDYESQLGMNDFGTQATTALSFVYALIIIFVIVGNIGYLTERRNRRNAQ